MEWTVTVKKSAVKQIQKLPRKVREALFLLVEEITRDGPVRGNWKNYSKLGKGIHHCHLVNGRPSYVAVWEEAGQGVRIVEVTYAGTREKAPY